MAIRDLNEIPRNIQIKASLSILENTPILVLIITLIILSSSVSVPTDTPILYLRNKVPVRYIVSYTCFNRLGK